QHAAEPWIRQIDPSHHSPDELVGLRQLEQPARLIKRRRRLYHHRSFEPVPEQDRRKPLRQEILPQDRGLGRHPCVLQMTQTPEVLVRVDSHFSGAKPGPIRKTLTRMLRNSTGAPLACACNPMLPYAGFVSSRFTSRTFSPFSVAVNCLLIAEIS